MKRIIKTITGALFELGLCLGPLLADADTIDSAGREVQTAQGYAKSNLMNGWDVIISYSQMIYDAADRVTTTLVETTGNVAP